MSVFNENAILGTSAAAAGGGYDIPYSCRFNSGDSAYMHFTPSGSGNQRTFTISCWFKIHVPQTTTAVKTMMSAGTNSKLAFYDNTIYSDIGADGSAVTIQYSPVVYRDTSSWYNFVFKVDTTQAATADRVTIYKNGVEDTAYTVPAGLTLNEDTAFNEGSKSQKWGTNNSPGYYWDGYLAEVHMVDGLALDADSFGEVDETYGHWKPIEYTGAHGTNGYHLDFSNPAALGNDVAGSNNFTVSGIAAHDQTTDTPTNNFCTMNPLNNYPNACTFAEGNLKVTDGGDGSGCWSNFGMNSGKWYCEVHIVSDAADPSAMIGISGSQPQPTLATELGSYPDDYIMGSGVGGANPHNRVRTNDTPTAYANLSTAAGETIGMALDLENNKMYWRADGGTWINSADPAAGSGGWPTSGYIIAPYSGHYHFAVGRWNPGTNVYVMNFGQDGTFAGNETAGDNADDNGYGNFLYDVPAGFKALCSKNLTSCAITPSKHFSVKLYDDGAGAKTGVGFQPDLVWLKASGITSDHHLTDAVRGVTKAIDTNAGSVEATHSAGLTAFGSDGFTVGTDNHYDDTTGAGMVAWCWKGGNATLGTGGFTQGTIASTCSRNVDAGFSIVSYTGTGSAGTVGHGLSVAPNLVIARNRDLGRTAVVGSVQSIASLDFTDYIALPGSDPLDDNDGMWDDTKPTASVFSVLSIDNTNRSSDKYIAYCFHNVEGYSKIGAYVGNASATDGTFIYCGFRPRWIMCKRTSGTGAWNIYDTTRANNNNNPVRERLPANLSYAAEPSSFAIDVLSNGFKHYNSDNEMNASSNYLYMAFAETPFKNANAR